MSQTKSGSPFLFSDDGKKFVGIKNPDGSESITPRLSADGLSLVRDDTGATIPLSGGVTKTLLGTTSLTTSGTQNTAVAFAATACNSMTIFNDSVALEYKRTSDTVWHTIRPFETKHIFGIADASDISVRRKDTATIRATQTNTVRAQLFNTSTAIACSNLNVTTTANTTYTAFASATGAALAITNTSVYDCWLKVNAGAVPIPLRRNETLVLPLTANANEISAVTASGNRAATLIGELFQAIPTLELRNYPLPNVISPDASIELGEFSGNETNIGTDVAHIPHFAPFTKFNPKGKMISVWNTAANTIVSGATVADTAVASTDVYATNGVRAQFGSLNAPVVTSTANSFSILSSVNTPAGIDVTNSAIHVCIQRLATTPNVSAMSIDLFSAGTPASPDPSNYHRLTLDVTTAQVTDEKVNHCFASRAAFGAKGYGINLFSAVGTGATLTAITYVRINITAATTGMQVRPSFVKCVKNYTTKGTVIFTFDDDYSGAINDALPLLAPYNFPAVLYPSPLAVALGQQNMTSGNVLIDQMRMLQDNFGWQIASQEFNSTLAASITGGEYSVDRTPSEWARLQTHNFVAGAAFGFDLDGMRDGSQAGGYTYTWTAEEVKKSQQIHSTFRMFSNAANSDASVSNGMTTYCDTNPPGNPWILQAVNLGTGSWSSNITGANLAARYQDYVTQAINAKGIAILSAHNDWNNATVQAAMAIFLPWLAGQVSAGNVQVTTLRELRKQQSNAVAGVN